MMTRPPIVLTAVVFAALALPACRRPPQYASPLPPGATALRRLPADQWPALRWSLLASPVSLQAATARSLAWFDKPSSVQFFPVNAITHEHARASVFALHVLLSGGFGPKQELKMIRRDFDLYQSVGWDGMGTVLFTGYYTPIVSASRTRTPTFRHPLYRQPADLMTDPATGAVRGRRVGQGVVPYPTRRQIESDPARFGLEGQELVWLPDRFTAYLVHLQGSARCEFTDGSTLYIGYAASNGRPYTSVSRLLAAEGKLDPNTLSLPAVQDHFRRHPEQLEPYIRRNNRFIFFKEYDGIEWPAGSLGFAVTPRRSLATDKTVFPRACITLVDTTIAASAGGTARFQQLLLDQDTGGAIRAAGRADIYMGIGPEAEKIAGLQYAEGQLYYLLLKRDRLAGWIGRMPPLTPRRIGIGGLE